MIEKLGHVSGYVFQGRRVTIHPPYKNFCPQNFDKGGEHKKDRDAEFYQL